MTPSATHVLDGTDSFVISIDTNIGFSYVEWFVNDERVALHIGNGLGTHDYLTGCDFDGLGSTEGNAVTVKAVAYRNPSNTDDHDSEEIEITVWTHPNDVSEISISFTDEIELGGTYAFTIALTPSNDNYSIESASVTVEVDGETAQSEEDIVEGGLLLGVAGAIPWKPVSRIAIVGIGSTTWKIVGAAGVVYFVVDMGSKTWNAVVRSKLTGYALCETDRWHLNTGYTNVGNNYTVYNYCELRHKTDNTDESTVKTESGSGKFTFDDVACGYDIEVQGLRGQKYHSHTGVGLRWVYYGQTDIIEVRKIGTRVFFNMFGDPSEAHMRDPVLMPVRRIGGRFPWEG